MDVPGVRTLVIDTATPALSVALFAGDALIGHAHEVIGRGHAERLLPAIAALPDGGRAERILVSCGPGSFTGIRVGIAAARALAFAWSADLIGYATLALIAADARAAHELDAATPLAVAVEGGHGEWFVAGADGIVHNLAPAVAAAAISEELVAGSRATDLVALRGHGRVLAAAADARRALALPEAALLMQATPLYGRAPDAQPAPPRT